MNGEKSNRSTGVIGGSMLGFSFSPFHNIRVRYVGNLTCGIRQEGQGWDKVEGWVGVVKFALGHGLGGWELRVEEAKQSDL